MHHYNVGLNRTQADDPATNWQVSSDDAVNYLVGRTGRDRSLCALRVRNAEKTGDIFVACDRRLANTASCFLVRVEGPMA